jgi:uncharacterized protein (TIGR00299 family) protein
MKVLVVDPRISGVAGDMLLAALVDLLGSDEALSPVAEACRSLDTCRTLAYAFRRVDAGGVGALRLDLRIDEDPFPDGPALREAAVDIARQAGIPEAGTTIALSVLDDLLAAEARLHGDGFRDHAVASIDTLFDVIGTIGLLEAGGLLDGEVYGLPPPLGGGVTETPCGPVAIPAPATVEVLCRRRVPWSSVPATTELTTPTGAALFANIAARVTDVFPAMTAVRTGYGVGTRPGGGRPGVLRLVEGTNFHGVADRIVMLETNLDDVSGEVVGYTIERLREAGAVDVFVTPAYGKKNRPVQVLHVITGPAEYERLLAILMAESGTLGVRVLDQPRLVAERRRETRAVTVAGRPFEVQVKTSSVDGRIVAVKAEYEDLRRIARELGRPLRSVEDEVRAALGGPRGA